MKEITSLLKRARKDINDTEYFKAAKKYEKVLQKDPDNLKAALGLAETAMLLAEYEKAHELIHAVALSEQDSPAVFRLWGRLYMKQKKDTEALDKLKMSYKLDKSEAQTIVLLGKAYRKEKDYKKSEKLLKKGLEIDKKNHELHYQLGQTYFFMEDYDRAEKCFKKSASLKKDYHEAISDLGYVYEKKKDPKKALKAWEKAYSVMPYTRYRKKQFFLRKQLERKYTPAVDATDYFKQAEVFNNKKDYENALKYLNVVLEKDKGYLEAYLMRAFIYYSQSKYIESIMDSLAASKLDPSCEQAVYLAGKAYSRIRNDKLALKYLNKAEKILPKDDRIYNSRALIFVTQDLHKALEDINKAICRYPTLADYYVNRAMILERLSQYEKAQADYEKAIAINPKDKYVKEKLEKLKVKNVDHKRHAEIHEMIEGYR